MYKPKIALLAKDVSIDGQTNSVSVFSIIEGFQIVGPTLIPEVAFFTLLTRQSSDPNKVETRFHISLDGVELANIPTVTINFSDKLQTRLVIRINGLPIPKPGSLVAQLLGSDGKVLAECGVTILPAPTSRDKIKFKASPASATTVEHNELLNGDSKSG